MLTSEKFAARYSKMSPSEDASGEETPHYSSIFRCYDFYSSPSCIVSGKQTTRKVHWGVEKRSAIQCHICCSHFYQFRRRRVEHFRPVFCLIDYSKKNATDGLCRLDWGGLPAPPASTLKVTNKHYA